jgi:hypothetical protein
MARRLGSATDANTPADSATRSATGWGNDRAILDAPT